MTRAALFVAMLLVLTGAARAQDPDMPPPGYHPERSSDEAGLWMQVNKAEALLKTSPALIRDPALNAYVRGVACRVSGAWCPSVRVYILDIPYFNVVSLPNGAIMVWSGLFLRTENEAQLAFVLGHELNHYLQRHSLEQFNRMVDTSSAVAVLGVAAAGIGINFVGTIASTAALNATYAHSRAQESDADLGGFESATAAGYDPGQAVAVWRAVAAEEDANPHKDRDVFFAGHPRPDQRLEVLQNLADTAAPKRADWIRGAAPFDKAMAPWQARWVDDELARGEPQESLVLFQRLSANAPARGLFHYALGEAYRKRGQTGDAALAQSAFRAAAAQADAPALAWRGLGLVAMKAGDKTAARAAFTQYRARAPMAEDRAMIDFYLTQL